MSLANTAHGNLNPTGEVSRVYLTVVDVILAPSRWYSSKMLVIGEMVSFSRNGLMFEASFAVSLILLITKMSILVCDGKLVSKIVVEVN